MPTPSSFDYALLRVVPRVERGEFINAGVIVFCRPRRFLRARIVADHARLAAFAPMLDVEQAAQHLAVIPLVCTGGHDAGPIGQLPLAERFHWLVAPRSTVIQASPVHGGVCIDPEEALERLFAAAVE